MLLRNLRSRKDVLYIDGVLIEHSEEEDDDEGRGVVEIDYATD